MLKSTWLMVTVLLFVMSSISRGGDGKEPVYMGKRLGAWIDQLKDKKESARLEAAAALGKIGADAVEPLMMALEGQDNTLRFYAAVALGRVGKPAVPSLLRAMQGRDTKVRQGAIHALGEVGPDAKAAIPELIGILKNEGGDLASEASHALGKIGKPAVDALVAALKDLDGISLMDAIRALGEAGAEAKSAVPDLRTVLKRGGFLIRIEAANALGKIGPDAKEAVPDLINALKDQNEFVREKAATALGRMGPHAKEAIPVLIDLLSVGPQSDYTRADVWLAASRALGQIGKEAVPLLVEALKSRDADVRKGAARALAGIGLDAQVATEPLTKALADRDAGVRAAAVSALGRIGADGKTVVPLIKPLLNEKDEAVRKAAAEALKHLEPDAKVVTVATEQFPFTLTRIKEELGPPDTEDGDVVDYKGKLNIRSFPLIRLELMVADNPSGLALTSKLLASKLFTKEEGKAISDLLKSKGGEKGIGRFRVTVKESIVVNDILILNLTPAATHGVQPSPQNESPPATLQGEAALRKVKFNVLSAAYSLEKTTYEENKGIFSWTLKSSRSKPLDDFDYSVWKAVLSGTQLEHMTRHTLPQGQKLILWKDGKMIAAVKTTLKDLGLDRDGYSRVVVQAEISKDTMPMIDKAEYESEK